MKSKRSKATDISKSVRLEVLERDKWCVFCGSSYQLTIAHRIPRSRGGLGVKENLVVACMQCHLNLDQSPHRIEMMKHVKQHLLNHYPNLDDLELIYKK